MKSIKNKIVKYCALLLKPKFAIVYKICKRPAYILDLGIANKSYIETKTIFPDSVYHGIDNVDHNLDIDKADKFILCDLEKCKLEDVTPHKYDLIIINHVLEHIERGQQVFEELCSMLQEGGVLFAEFPSIRTATKKKVFGRYHFNDDHTHKTFYILELLANAAMKRKCIVISCGPISTFLKSILSYPRAFVALCTGREWGPYLLHVSKKIDHIVVRRKIND